MESAPIKAVRDPGVSLWQSAVAQTLIESDELKALRLQSPDVMAADGNTATTVEAQLVTLAAGHELSLAAAAHAAQDVEDVPFNARTAGVSAGQVEMSRLAKELGEAIAAGDTAREAELRAALEAAARKYSTGDTEGWYSCAKTYAKYLLWYHHAQYRDWRVEGQGNMHFGVIDWKLPNNARVAIVGDWGTSMDDAVALLEQIRDEKVDAVIHLGDIYYSGTPEECTRMLGIVASVFADHPVPFFSIPGNHDYFALGYGFYPMIDEAGKSRPEWRQAASYFCLRTEDGRWQFLGMDTGFNDGMPRPVVAPWLMESEAQWHRDKLDQFGGKTILLSHHQLFSANDHIRRSGRPYLNEYLLNVFQPYFEDKVAAWFWGHEHNLVLYRDGLFGLRKGRLVGASSYEETTGEDPYKVNYPQVPYLDADFRLDAAEDYYNHSFAIVNLAPPMGSAGAASVTYYQYPSWAGIKHPRPPRPDRYEVYTETLDVVPPPPPTRAVRAGEELMMATLSGKYVIASEKWGLKHFPRLGNVSQAVRLILPGPAGELHDGTQVIIRTTEKSVGSRHDLGTWKRTNLYYFNAGSKEERWIIRKRDTRQDAVIRYGDDVFFENVSWKEWLVPDENEQFLTTRGGFPMFWKLVPV